MKPMKSGLAGIVLLLLPHLATAQMTAVPTKDVNEKTNTSDAKPASIYNVDPYSGTASVTIPIYNFSVDGLDLGVSLNYDTRGIKVDQTADNTGLGFSVFAGGYIQRTAYGLEDEAVLPVLNKNGVNGFPAALQTEKRGNLVSTFGQTGTTETDREYDVFEANLAGRTIKFVIGTCRASFTGSSCNCDPGTHRLLVTYPKSEVQVELLHSWGINAFRSDGSVYEGATFGASGYPVEDRQLQFKITDEKGNIFYFDYGDYEKKYVGAPGAINPFYYYPTSRWVLKKIVTGQTGQVINYAYNRSDFYTFPAFRNEQVREILLHDEGTTTDHHTVLDTIRKEVDSAALWTGKTSSLSRIDFPNGTTVTFNYDSKERCDLPGNYALNSIQVKSSYDNNVFNVFTYKFNYAYFHSPIFGNANTEIPYDQTCTSIKQSFGYSVASQSDYHAITGLRLKLKSIDKVGSDNLTTEKYYSFDYYNAQPLPERLSPGKDYYGYYNGKTPVFAAHVNNPNNLANLSNSSIPLHTFTTNLGEYHTYGVDKSSDSVYMQACNLIKVTNGLGGSVEFYYKNHTLYNPANSYTSGNSILPNNYQGADANDGLCIDKIIIKDGYNIDNSTMTKYVFEDGQRFFRGGYYWLPDYYELTSNISDVNQRFNIYNKRYFSDMINPRYFLNGFNHGYTFATIKNYGYNNELLNSEKITFSNLMDNNNPSVSNLSMRIFGCPNCVNSLNNPDPRVVANAFYPNYMHQYRMGQVLVDSNFDMNNTLVSKTVNTYQDVIGTSYDYSNMIINAYSTKGATYPYYDQVSQMYIPIEYAKRLLQTSTTTKYLNGSEISTIMNYTYNTDDNVSNVTWTDSKGLNCEKRFSYTFNQMVDGSELWRNGNLISKTKLEAAPFAFDHYYSLKTDIPVSLGAYNSNNYTLSLDKNFDYDDHRNTIQTTFEDGKYYSASIWDTRLGVKIADAKNAKYSEIAYTSFEGSFAAKGTLDFNKGNWDFDPANIVNNPGLSMTGHYYYNLNPGTNNQIVGLNVLENNKKFILSFWCWGTAQVYYAGQLVNQSIINNGVNNGWRLAIVAVTGNGTDKITITTASSSKIDEIRLHPTNATMTTSTYEPLLGISSVNNERNDIVYYEYDAMGKQLATRDIYKHILIYRKYVTQGADN